MINKVLNSRYELGAMIGTGGMADVYIAEDLRLHRKVAVKILRSDLARDPSFITRFKKEALAAGGLNNQGIVAVFDSGEDGPDSYIVMELVKGHTLRQVLQTHTEISQAEAVMIIAEILEALKYSHEQGIIHRDIKPGNIMITDSGKVKVMDFGIARALDDIGATMTNTWSVVGTAQYLSPEQATGEYADARSDIYSLGCLMFELLTGRPPFIGDTPVSIAFQHVSAPLPAPSDLNPGIDPNLETIIKVALHKDPNNRYQDAGAMLEDLQRAMRGEPVTTKIRPTKPRRKLFVIGGIALALLLILVSTLISRSSQPNLTPLVIPNVVGLTEAEARALLPNFTINIQNAVSSTIPKGRISAQIPLAATKVVPGSSVTLSESTGAGNTAVPINLVGLSLADARNSLTSAGLTVAQTISVSSSQAPGTVLGVSPAPGSILVTGSGVVLQIANGTVPVPNLLGLTEVQALTTLTQAGFVVRTATAFDPTQPLQIVLAQAPDAGTTQNVGSAVTITVNTQPTN